MPFNTGEREYAPAFYKNGIVFCSNRINTAFITYLDEQSQKPTIDLYYISSDSDWTGKPELFSKTLKSHYHDGPASFSANNSIVFLTRSLLSGKKLGDDLGRDIKLGIFWSEQKEGDWGKVHIFPFNSQKHDIGHPCISKDQKTLFFSSDMKGGYGGKDIYVSHWENGEWSEPQNLGATVNSKSNEMFPFFHENGRLYFSSDRAGGLGGMDIYFTSKKDSIWTPVTRLTSPVNSSHDDFSFIADDDHEKGFFSSNRAGNDDIFSFEMVYPEFENCDSIQETFLCYDFFEETTAGIDTLPLIYEWDFGDGTKKRALETGHCFPGEGSYTIRLNIIDTLLGQVYKNEAAYDLEITEAELGIISEDTLIAGKSYTFFADDKNWDQFEITGWYWNIGGEQKTQGREMAHQFSRSGKYRVQLGVTGLKGKARIYSKACVFKDILVIREKSE